MKGCTTLGLVSPSKLSTNFLLSPCHVADAHSTYFALGLHIQQTDGILRRKTPFNATPSVHMIALLP